MQPSDERPEADRAVTDTETDQDATGTTRRNVCKLAAVGGLTGLSGCSAVGNLLGGTEYAGRVVGTDGSGVNGATVLVVDGDVTDEPFRTSFGDYGDDSDRTDLTPVSVQSRQIGGRDGRFPSPEGASPDSPVYLATWVDTDGYRWFSDPASEPDELVLRHQQLFGPASAPVSQGEFDGQRYDVYSGTLDVWRSLDADEPLTQSLYISVTQAMSGFVRDGDAQTFELNPWEISLDRTAGPFSAASHPWLETLDGIFSWTVPEQIDGGDVEVDYDRVTTWDAIESISETEDARPRELLSHWHSTRRPRLPSYPMPDVAVQYSPISLRQIHSRREQYRQREAVANLGLDLSMGLVTGALAGGTGPGLVWSALDFAGEQNGAQLDTELGGAVSPSDAPDGNTHDEVSRSFWASDRAPCVSVVYEVPVEFPDVDAYADVYASALWSTNGANSSLSGGTFLTGFAESFSLTPRRPSEGGERSAATSVPERSQTDTRTAADSSAQSWPMFRATLGNSGTVPGTTGPAAPDTERWRARLDGAISASPAVAGDDVLIGDEAGVVHCIHSADGRERWRFETGDSVRSSAAVVDGVVYVGSDDNALYAIDLATGEERWRFDTGGNVGSSPAVSDGTVYVGRAKLDGTGGAGRIGGVYAIDAADGSREWLFESGSHVIASPAVRDGTVYVGTNGAQNTSRFFALDAVDGSVRWETDSYGFANVSSSPALADGTVFVGRNTTGVVGWLYAFDAATGEQRWRQKIDVKPRTASPVVDGDSVYIYSGQLWAFNATTGAERWNWRHIRGDGVTPAVDGTRVYAGTPNRRLHALDVSDGSEVWSFSTESPIRSSPTVDDGVVYVGTDNGSLYAIEE